MDSQTLPREYLLPNAANSYIGWTASQWAIYD